MNGGRKGVGAVLGFTALAGFVASHWFALVVDPSVWRWALCTAIAAAAAAALLALGAARSRPATVALAGAAILAAALVAALAATGLPVRLLAPGAWGELREQVSNGLTGVSELELPYGGPREWTRLSLLLAAPLTLVAAAAVAFWPRAGGARLRRGVALVLLVALYGVAVSWDAPSAELARGFGLLAAIALFLWLPGLPASRMTAAVAAVAVAGLAAIPAAARIGASEPVVNYKDWALFGKERTVTFGWNHSYGPLDWPQQGTGLFSVSGVDRPLYWKTWVLDDFEGAAWARGDGGEASPDGADPASGVLAVGREEPADRWIETFDVSVRALRSDLLVTTGVTQEVTDADVVASAPDGTTTLAGDPLPEDASYTVTAYAPDPSARLLARVDDGRYPRALERYTMLMLPHRFGRGIAPEAAPESPLVPVITPLRGEEDRASDQRFGPPARRLIKGTPYAPVETLARQLTRDADGNYEAVMAIERHLVTKYGYEQDVPERRNPLPAFLFQDRQGYCQQFSGAMALMLRLIGIPSRVVSGFAPGVRDPGDDQTYVVRDTDAHSWVEVWFPKVGWVTVDPTPSAAPARTEDSLGGTAAGDSLVSGLGRGFSIEQAAQSGPGRELTPRSRDEAGSSPASALFSLLVIAGGGGFGFAYRRRRRRLLAPEGAPAQLRELDRALRAAGVTPPPGATLRRIEREVERLAGPAAAGYLARMRDNRYRAGRPRRPGPVERRALRRDLSRGKGPRGRLRMLWAIPPGGPRGA